jgi:hypothetical protein
VSVLGYIGVAPDSTGKKIHNVVQDVGGGELRYQQVIAFGDPDDPTTQAQVRTTAPAAGSAGVVVRQAPADFDSGLFLMEGGGGFTVIIAANLNMDVILLVNPSPTFLTFTIIDGNGGVYLQDAPVPPNSMQAFPMHGLKATGGLSAKVDGPNTGFVQVRGNT